MLWSRRSMRPGSAANLAVDEPALLSAKDYVAEVSAAPGSRFAPASGRRGAIGWAMSSRRPRRIWSGILIGAGPASTTGAAVPIAQPMKMAPRVKRWAGTPLPIGKR